MGYDLIKANRCLRKISDAKSVPPRSHYQSSCTNTVRSSDFSSIASFLFAQPRMSGTYDLTTLDDTFGEWTTLDNSFCLERSCASPPIDLVVVKTTMAYYNSLSTWGTSPLSEWIDGPLGIVNSWIELHVPNGRVPDRRVPSKDIFIPFIVYGYDDEDGCHLIESFNFKSERTKVDFTRVSPPSIRHQGGRKYLSEIRPQSVIVEEDTDFERTALHFYLQGCSTFELINKFNVKITMDFYSSLSKNNTSPLFEWVDNPNGLVNSWIELRVPNTDSFLLFIVRGYENRFHLIESFAFKSLKCVVNLTLLPSGSIRQPGDRVFLSEILPQSDIVKDVSDANMTEAADAQTDVTKDVVIQTAVDLTLLPSGSIRQPGDRVFLSEILPQSDIVKDVSDANMTEAADAQTDVSKDVVIETAVDLTLLPSGSIRQPGDRVFLSEILPQSDIVKDVSDANMTEAADAQTDVSKDVVIETAVDLTLLPSGSIRQPGDRAFVSEILPQSDIVEEVSDANMPEAVDAQTDITKDVVKLADEVTEANLDRIRRQYVANMCKQKNEMAEVLRNLTLETQQRDWEKQQKDKKAQRKLKTAQEKKKK